MIKAKMSDKAGRQVVFLGLAFENLDRLREGQPIIVRGDGEMDLPFDIVIHADKDEAAILTELRRSGTLPDAMVEKHPKCPDDGTELSWALDQKSMHCMKCKRQFGVMS